MSRSSIIPTGVQSKKKMSERVSVKKLRESGITANASLNQSEFADYSTLTRDDIGNDRYLRGSKKSHSVMMKEPPSTAADKITLYRDPNERETMMNEISS